MLVYNWYMRDIRPGKKPFLGKKPKPVKELYEASLGPKKEKQKNGAEQDIIRSVGRKSGKEVKREDKKLAGSKVEVTNIHLKKPPVKMYGGVDNVKKRPLFMKTSEKGAKKIRKDNKVKVGRSEKNVIVILSGLLLIAGAAAAIIFLPTANIILTLKTAPLLVDEELVIGDVSSLAGNVVPGTTFYREVQIEGSTAVTNSEIVGEKAGGSVAIVNKTTQEQRIKERSRLVTEDGQLFYMIKHAIVPPNSRINVAVEASEAGEEGNIEPQRLDFAALDDVSQSVVYAEATDQLSGGSGETVLVVGESDIDNMKKEAQAMARSQAENEIKNEVPLGWIIVEESWSSELESLEAAAEIGEKKQVIDYVARATVRVMGVEKEVLEGKLRSALEERLADEFMLFPGAISYSKTINNIDWENVAAAFSVRVTHTTIPRLSIDTLKGKLAGRSEEEAARYLEGLPGVESAAIKLWPFWVRSIPRIEKRISLEFESLRQP